jgi:acyl-coenzyme A synthetase/AMP-(fatty) acid ligase
MIYFWAQTTPQRPAIIQSTGVTTYRALADGIEKAAEYFAKSLPDRSKPITIWLPSPPKMLLASLGLLRANCGIIVTNGPELSHIPLSDSNTLVYDRDEKPPGDRTNIAFDISWLEVGINPSPPNRRLRQAKARNADIFFFTPGIAGPKRIVQTQRAWDQCILFNGTSAFADYERALLSIDVNSVVGFARAYEVLYAGKTLCFARQGLQQLWLANTYDIDLFIASPQQALELADLQEKVTRYSLAALKTVRLEGAVLSADGIRRIKSNLGRNVILNYSTAEAGIVASAPHDVIADIPNAVGFVIPEADVQIVDIGDNILPAGSEGFVRIRTSQFLRNFQIEDFNTWLYPGDVGWLTEDGLLCIAGPKADFIRGGNVGLSITDFDDFLLSCPGVKDAGVCTQIGTSGLEEYWVGVVLEPSADIGAFRKGIEANTDFGINIDRLYLVEVIPRDTLGKIQRDELREMLQNMSK